jgi:hypothetical protein
MIASIDYPDALDADDIEAVVAYIRANYSTHEIHIHDAETLHFGYWDESERYIATGLLHHLQAAGYALVHVGRDVAPESGQWRAWMECRKHAPGERDRTLTCPRCEHAFTPITVSHLIVGGGVAHYLCPECANCLEACPPRPAVSGLSGGDPR